MMTKQVIPDPELNGYAEVKLWKTPNLATNYRFRGPFLS